ncbi:MAG: adenylyltransferase/cytidyltransferase family protein [bacterium]|nr:adenylyltransferase/cytidyltransferase family protein [bacterium]
MENHKKIVVVVSGGFDPVHIGHVRMFNEAKALGDELVVILNNDNWLKKKKRYAFMPQEERKEIIEAFRAVDRVVFTHHSENPTDMSVCEMLEKIHPDIFAQGGDRDNDDAHNTSSSLKPEYELCDRLGIKMMFNVGEGGKVQSSSWLIEKAQEK